MTYDWAFLPMQRSNELLGAPDRLRQRLADDGYLYFEQILPVEKLRRIREQITGVLAGAGWIAGGDEQLDARVIRTPVREGEDDFWEPLAGVQKLQSFHEFGHDPVLTDLMHQVVGSTAFAHPLKICRMIFPEFEAISTPPHQDFPNNQGTEGLTATWIPLSDVPVALGGLAILRGSHRWGPLPLETHLGAGNRCAQLPLDMLEQCRWVTTEFTLGDVLVFPSLTVHASRHNLSANAMRLSIDYRWQREGEPLTEGCLSPHFGTLDWEDIYADWDSDEHQYYWRDLDYRIAPFEELPVHVAASAEEMIGEYLRQEHRSNVRRAQRGAVRP
ncbi:MAG: phytanoyl-CoA dioxygenase family protein [Acidimicrobiales bacterium]